MVKITICIQFSGHPEIYKLLIEESEKKNIDFINATDVMGMSVLHYVAMNRKNRNTEMLRFLLEKNTNVNAIASDNTTPLQFASATGENIISQSLISFFF